VLDRRAFVRYCPDRDLPCSVNVVLGGSSWTARLADLSTDGIAIISDCWLPAETTLLAKLDAAGDLACRTFLAHLCHATPRPSGDYHLGARLVNGLTKEQLREFMQSANDNFMQS